MSEREEEAGRDRPLALLHQLSGHVVDGGDMIGVDRVTKPERIGERSGPEQDRLIAKLHECPEPCQHIRRSENDIEKSRLGLQRGGLVVEYLWKGDAQGR